MEEINIDARDRYVNMCESSIRQNNAQAERRIAKRDLHSIAICFVAEGGGQSVQTAFTGEDAVALILQRAALPPFVVRTRRQGSRKSPPPQTGYSHGKESQKEACSRAFVSGV